MRFIFSINSPKARDNVINQGFAIIESVTGVFYLRMSGEVLHGVADSPYMKDVPSNWKDVARRRTCIIFINQKRIEQISTRPDALLIYASINSLLQLLVDEAVLFVTRSFDEGEVPLISRYLDEDAKQRIITALVCGYEHHEISNDVALT